MRTQGADLQRRCSRSHDAGRAGRLLLSGAAETDLQACPYQTGDVEPVLENALARCRKDSIS